MIAIPLLLTAVGSACLGIIVPTLWFAVFPGLALFFLLLRSHTRSAIMATMYGLLFGCATGGAGTIWFWDTLPLSFLGITDPTVQRAAVGMTWGYVATSLGLPVMLGAAVIWRFRASRWFTLVTPLVWALTEIGRMWSFAITTWGRQSLLGPHFSSAAIGYAITENPHLARLAYPLGIDALNLFVAAVAACVAIAPGLRRQKVLRVPFALTIGIAILLCIISITGTPASPPVGPHKLRFAVISENIRDVRDLSTHQLLTDTLANVAAARPPVDVIILPEEFSLTSIFWSKNEASNFLATHFADREVLILNTRNNLYPEDERNEQLESKKLVYDTTSRGEIGRYTKQMLMPLGEYAPAFTQTFFSVLDDPELHLYLKDVAAGPPHTDHLSVGEFHGVRLGGLLCSDMLSPHLYRSLVRDHRADVLVNLSNHFWFHGSKTLYSKTLQMARVHAIQNHVPLLVSNNMAPSFALDGQGHLIAEAPWGSRSVLYVDLPTPSSPPFERTIN